MEEQTRQLNAASKPNDKKQEFIEKIDEFIDIINDDLGKKSKDGKEREQRVPAAEDKNK